MPRRQDQHKFLVIDLEMTGLPIFRSKGALPQPSDLDAYYCSRMIEIAWQLFSSDGTLEHEKSMLVHPVRPTQLQWHPVALKKHGILPKEISECLITTRTAINALNDLFVQCTLQEHSVVIVGHNVQVDLHVLESEAIRIGHDELLVNMRKSMVHCTMFNNTLFCGLLRHDNSLKWPSLDELCTAALTEEEIENFAPKHRALADVQRTAMCFFRLHPLLNLK